jgi:pseudaminic acid synthase
MPPIFKINNRAIGSGHPVYIIAELSGNHMQSFERCVELISAAKFAGVDAIKLQTYTADTITIDCKSHYFQIDQGTVWDGQSLYELYRDAHTPWEWQPRLKKIANDLGLDLFSSPFDATAVDFLELMQVPAYKVASFELVDTPLLERIGRTKKPVIMSTGMATRSEIETAVKSLRSAGTEEIALLKCTSAYPAPAESMNLRTIGEMQKVFDFPIGLSDHMLSHEASIASVALGASIIEKHLTIRRSDGGPDAGFSLEPDEFANLVQAVRTTEEALGTVQFGPTIFDSANRAFRKSLFVVCDIPAGQPFTDKNIRSIRPGYGLEPRFYTEILGKVARNAIVRGTPVSWDLVQDQGS